MRFLILIFLFYVGYRYFKSWKGRRIRRRPFSDSAERRIDDILVKDPYCETYIPEREALKTKMEGRTVYFCSEKCRRSYLEASSKTDA